MTKNFDNVPAYSAGNLPEQAAKSGAIQTKSQFFTAMRVQVPREIDRVRSELLSEAKLAGEIFYYRYEINDKNSETGKSIVEGPSIGLASCAVRIFGNCFTDVTVEEEREYSWVFKAVFIDLEKGFHCSRIFMQPRPIPLSRSKNLGFAAERKVTIAYQIGQSKAIRNVGILGLPNWLIAHAMEAAKSSVADTSAGEAGKKKLDAVIKYFSGIGVSKDDLGRFLGMSDSGSWGDDQIARLREAASTINQGVVTVDEIFHPEKEAESEREPVANDYRQTQSLKSDPPEMPGLTPADQQTYDAYNECMFSDDEHDKAEVLSDLKAAGYVSIANDLEQERKKFSRKKDGGKTNSAMRL